MKHSIIVILILFMGYNLSMAQGTDFQYSMQKMYISFTFLPTQTTILNNGIYNTSNVRNTSGFTINGITELGFNLTKNFSLSTGIGIKSYSTVLDMDNYYNSYDSIDSENDNYEMQVSGSGIVEEQKITYLSVPFKIHYNLHFTRKIGAYINSGIMFSMPLSKNYSGSGYFDYKGYYPDYNITLFNLPEYGFPENVNLNISDKLDIVTINYNFFASIGFSYSLNSFLDLSLGLYYDQSLSSISNYESNTYQLSRTSDEYNSLMGSTSEVKIKAIGSSLAVSFYIK